jgi:hypothetical protein
MDATCAGSLGYPFYKNALKMTTTPIISSLSTSRARFSTQLFPCLFWNGYPKEPAQGAPINLIGAPNSAVAVLPRR